MRWVVGLWVFLWAQGEQTPVPFTLADKERLIRLEAQQEAIQKEMQLLRELLQATNARIDGLAARIDRLEVRMAESEKRADSHFYALLGLIGTTLALVVGLIGFIVWDRRKALREVVSPVEEKVAELQRDRGRLESLIASLREYARSHADLAAILQKYGLM